MELTRRRLLLYSCSMFSTLAPLSPCIGAQAIWPKSGPTDTDIWPNSKPSSTLNSPEKVRGCSLSSAAFSNFAHNIKLSVSSGNTALDRNIAAEGDILSSAFKRTPAFCYFDDGMSPNAFATLSSLIPWMQRPHGSVILGLRLLLKESRSHPLWETAVIGIMAHEWAHIYQQTKRIHASVPKLELHADLLAGWYLGIKGAIGRNVGIHGFASSLFEKGDYSFYSSQHHGTPNQRVEAMSTGFSYALATRDTDVGYVAEIGFKWLGSRFGLM